MGMVGRITLVLLALGVLVFGLVVAGYYIAWGVAPWQGRLEVQIETHTGEYMMASYNYFYSMHEVILSYQTTIDNQEELLYTACSNDQRERIQTNIVGIEGQRALSIAEYNARSAAQWTTGQFRDWSLPYRMAVVNGVLFEYDE